VRGEIKSGGEKGEEFIKISTRAGKNDPVQKKSLKREGGPW